MDSDRCHCGSCGTQITMEKSWQYHLQKTFVKKLQELYDAEQFWDVKIFVHGKEYKCHRLVLSAHSEYFKTLFTSEFQESREKCVHLEPPVTRRCFDKIIQYMYKGEPIVEDANVAAILQLADYLQIHHLSQKCASVLEVNIGLKNCFTRLKIARKYNLDVLRDAVVYFIIKHYKALIDNYRDKFLQLDKEDFIEIIEDENLYTVSEMSVCSLAVHWLLYNFDTRKDCFEDVLKVLKLPLVDSEYLINFMRYFPKLQCLPYIQQYIDEGLTHQLVPTKRSSTDTFRSLHRVNHDMIDMLMICGGDVDDGNNIKKAWYCAPVNGFLRDVSENFKWKVLPILTNFLKTPEVLMAIYGNTDLYIMGNTNHAIGGHKSHNYNYNGISGRLVKMRGSPLPLPMEHCLCECTGDYIYVFGGYDEYDDPIWTVSRYDTKRDVWEHVGCLVEPATRTANLSGIIGSRIYIFKKRYFNGEFVYFQVYDTKTDACNKYNLFDFAVVHTLGFPNACVSIGEAIYLFICGNEKAKKAVSWSMVKFTDCNGMNFERIGETFHAESLLIHCQMLYLEESLYIFCGKEDHDKDYERRIMEKVERNDINRFSLKDKKFYEVDIKLPETNSYYMIQRFTARKEMFKAELVGRLQNQ